MKALTGIANLLAAAALIAFGYAVLEASAPPRHTEVPCVQVRDDVIVCGDEAVRRWAK